MSQEFHIKRDNQITTILEWLAALPKEKRNNVPIHHIQSFQIVTVPFQNNAQASYVALVLCQHISPQTREDRAAIERLLDIQSS